MGNCLVTRKGGTVECEELLNWNTSYSTSSGNSQKVTTTKDYKRVYIIVNGNNGGGNSISASDSSLEKHMLKSVSTDLWSQNFTANWAYYDDVKKGTTLNCGHTGYQGSILVIGVVGG